MKINYHWLQEYIIEPLPSPEKLVETILFHAFEVENVEEVNGTTVFDVKTLPDRNHDCLSHYGMAREVAGLLGLTLKELTHRSHEFAESDIKVHIQTDICRRYIARKVFDVKVKPSPTWLKERLESIGQRSINNIVDATNYLMFSLGQPMHAFDYDKLGNGEIFIRQAFDGEEMTTLDGKLVPLDPSIAVIANNKTTGTLESTGILAVAGVKGGKAAEVDEHTKTIIIEVANFEPTSVRKASKKLNLPTDSAKRFENELTPHLGAQAIHLVTDLIVDLAGGQPENIIDEYPNPVTQREVLFSTDHINKMLGSEIPTKEIIDILNRYHYSFEEENGDFKLSVPFERLDITGPHDMVEEIGRIYGYDKITPVFPKLDFKPKINETFAKICAIKADLISKGYSEVQTYTFTKKGDFEVARGAVGKSALRKNLTDGLTQSYELNKRNEALLGVNETKIFEIGTVFPKSGEVTHVAFADKKGVREMALDEYVAENKLSASTSEYAFVENTGKEDVKFVPWSEYPYMTRDIAIWIPESVSKDEVKALIMENAGALSMREPRLFDTFTKDGKTSVAFRLVFQSFERTLTDEEINRVMEAITGKVQAKGWEVR